MEIDLSNKSFCIVGLPDSGKSTLANYILAQFGEQAMIYDTLNEYPDKPFDSYTPKQRMDTAELETVTRAVMRAKKYKLFVIDEANRYCPNQKPLPQAIADLNDFRAHYGLSVGFICRRPVQLNTSLVELAHYLFIFRLPGRNDLQFMQDTAKGLEVAVENLEPYHFVIVHPNRTFTVSAPVPREYATNKLIQRSGTSEIGSSKDTLNGE